MHITSLLSPQTIQVNLQAANKREAIDRTVDLLRGAAEVLDLEEVRRVVIEREGRMSTGVGKGLGLPHGKSPDLTASIAAMSVTEEAVDFDAFDGEPVRIVFLLVGPMEAHTLHIRTLSRISRLMNDSATRSEVLAAKSPQAVFDIIHRAEAVLLEEEKAR